MERKYIEKGYTWKGDIYGERKHTERGYTRRENILTIRDINKGRT